MYMGPEKEMLRAVNARNTFA